MNQATFAEKMARVEWLAQQDKMAALTLPTRGTCVVDDKTAVMDREYFDELGEYSSSLPTGTYIGKRWKRDMNGAHPHWKCDTCGAVYVGWSQDDQPCKKCDGKIHFFEMPEDWWMGEYYDVGSKDEVGIRWRRIIVT